MTALAALLNEAIADIEARREVADVPAVAAWLTAHGVRTDDGLREAAQAVIRSFYSDQSDPASWDERVSRDVIALMIALAASSPVEARP